MNEQKGALRVWHIPQVPMNPFHVDVENVEQAKKIITVLAEYDQFQFDHNIKPDYSNVSGLEVFESGEWVEWYDEFGNDIWEMEE